MVYKKYIFPLQVELKKVREFNYKFSSVLLGWIKNIFYKPFKTLFVLYWLMIDARQHYLLLCKKNSAKDLNGKNGSKN